MQTDKQAEKLYFECEKYIEQTIQRRYPNRKSFVATHGLDEDDLIQYGRIGLYRACKTFNPTKGKSMQNYAIQSIIWMINDELTKDSLNNVDNKSLILLDKNSLDNKFSAENGEDLYLHDVIGEEDGGYKDIDEKSILESLADRLPEQLFKVVEMRYQGHTFTEIGEALGVTAQYCSALLKRNKSNVSELIFA